MVSGQWSVIDHAARAICRKNEERMIGMLKQKAWWRAALIRALKTVCQTAAATIGTSALIEQVNWLTVLSASALAGVLSLLTSLAGLPEVSAGADCGQLARAAEEDDA